MTIPPFIRRRPLSHHSLTAAKLDRDAAVLEGIAAMVRAAPMLSDAVHGVLLESCARRLEDSAEECRLESRRVYPPNWGTNLSQAVNAAHHSVVEILVARAEYAEAGDDVEAREAARLRWHAAFLDSAALAAVNHSAFELGRVEEELIEPPPEANEPGLSFG